VKSWCIYKKKKLVGLYSTTIIDSETSPCSDLHAFVCRVMDRPALPRRATFFATTFSSFRLCKTTGAVVVEKEKSKDDDAKKAKNNNNI
jgi:hypothetical protein